MSLSTDQCNRLSEFLFRRVPDFDKELAKDRFPISNTYNGLYPTGTWPSETGVTHTWDRVHVTRPDDDGCWESLASFDQDPCAPLCDPQRVTLGWGSTRNTYTRYHRDYVTPVFCYDQLRNIEMATQQLSAIIEALKELPNNIVSDFLRLYSLRSANQIYICDDEFSTVTVSDSIFTNQCSRVNLGSTANLPNSKLTMQYLEHYAPTLFYQGYFNKQFAPDSKFTMFTDISTVTELCNANPALTQMYNSADFQKGGQYFKLGAMRGCGDFLFKIDPTPLRFQHIGSGVLQRIQPYQNVAATLGKKPVFDPNYELAEYQMYHVYNAAARQVFVGDTSPVSPDMPFLSRNLMGKWGWKMPDYFKAIDPNSGSLCEFDNVKKNKGFFLGEYELGVKTLFPEIEMCIIAKRESTPVANVPRVAAANSMIYQTLTPYNSFCEES
jgi:hypothetical protein